MNGEIQKISNYTDKKRSTAEINILKEEIFKFIKQKLNKNQDMTLIFRLFKEKDIYYDFMKIAEKF